MANWPAAKSGYAISDIDSTSDPKYFGFLDDSGEWYILQMTSGSDIRYFRGSINYSTNWTNRAGLSYDYYSEVF